MWVLAVVLCLLVRLSQVGVLLKQLNVGSCKQCHDSPGFFGAKNLREIEKQSSPTEVPNAGGVR